VAASRIMLQRANKYRTPDAGIPGILHPENHPSVALVIEIVAKCRFVTEAVSGPWRPVVMDRRMAKVTRLSICNGIASQLNLDHAGVSLTIRKIRETRNAVRN
jgi:hypothetical protein